MYKLFIGLVVVMMAAGCGQISKSKNVRGSVEKPFPEEKDITPELPPPPAPYTGPITYCFEKREGENGENITSMRISVDQDSIKGVYESLPKEGATIRGTVEGIIFGNIFSLVYRYKQNGVDHAEQMIFKFEKGKLYRKVGAMVEQNGELVLDNPVKATFQLALEQVDCKESGK